jgi:hypothetical protein
MQKIIVDLSKPKGQRELIVDLTPEEIAEREIQAIEAEAQQLAEQEAEAKKQADKEAGILALKGLGLTDDQITALVGN